MNKLKNIMEMSWQDISNLPPERSVVFITFAPISQHGIHLPLGTDIYEGKTWEIGIINSLIDVYKDFFFLFMPPVPIAHGFFSGFPGNIHFKQKTIHNLAFELLSGIASWGIRNIIVIASHEHPRHHIAIEEACERVNRKYGVCSFSPMGSIYSHKDLGLELMSSKKTRDMGKRYPEDHYSGWKDTSMMMDINGSLIKDNYKEIPDIPIKTKNGIFPAKASEKTAGFGHVGYPSASSEEVGALLNSEMINNLVKAVSAFIERKDYKKYQHHNLYKNLFYRTGSIQASIIIFSLIAAIVFLFMILFQN